MHIIAGSAGVVISFSVMGVFSVGLFYAPLAHLLLLRALASRQRQPQQAGEQTGFQGRSPGCARSGALI